MWQVPCSFFADLWVWVTSGALGVSLGRILGVSSMEPLCGGGGEAVCQGALSTPPLQLKTRLPKGGGSFGRIFLLFFPLRTPQPRLFLGTHPPLSVNHQLLSVTCQPPPVMHFWLFPSSRLSANCRRLTTNRHC